MPDIRSRIPPINAHLSRWITNLATFAGLLYRKHCDTDVKGLLSWSVRALAEGGEPAMAAGKVSRYHLLAIDDGNYVQGMNQVAPILHDYR